MSLRIRFAATTAATLALSIERLSDGLLYDFDDSTFKAAPKTPLEPIPEDTGIFVGRYKATLTPTPVAQFSDGHYAVTIHDTKNNNIVVAELAAYMIGGDDTPSGVVILQALAELKVDVDKPKPVNIVFPGTMFPAS